MAKAWTADRRLWLDASHEKVLEDGDPEAAVLLVSGPGRQVPPHLVERYKLKNKPKAKAKKAPANKARAAGADKGDDA